MAKIALHIFLFYFAKVKRGDVKVRRAHRSNAMWGKKLGYSTISTWPMMMIVKSELKRQIGGGDTVEFFTAQSYFTFDATNTKILEKICLDSLSLMSDLSG